MPARGFSIDGVMIQDIATGHFTNTQVEITYERDGVLTIDFVGDEYRNDNQILGVSIQRIEGELQVVVYDTPDSVQEPVTLLIPKTIPNDKFTGN